MTQDEIIEMARQAGLLPEKSNVVYQHSMFETYIQRFAKLVAAKEREACAKIIDDSYETTTPNQGIPEDWLLTLSEAIRSRGEKA